MTTVIVLPAPPATRAATPAQAGDAAGADPQAGTDFAQLLDQALTEGEAQTAATPDAQSPAGWPAADQQDAEATPEADAQQAPLVPLPTWTVTTQQAAEAEDGPAPTTPEPTPLDDLATADVASPSPRPVPNGTAARTTEPIADADAQPEATPTPAQASASDGTRPAEAARPDGTPGLGVGPAERSGAGGASRPGGTAEVTPVDQPAQAPAAAQSAQQPERPTATTPVSTPAEPGTPRPLATQIADQLEARFPALRAAGPGTHVLTMRVEPEHFGPVRVVAHIGTDGVRIELLGGTDAARDALRQALPDLRRDLAGVGLSAELDLGHRSAGRPDGGAAGDASDRGGDQPRPGAASDLGDDRRRAPEPTTTDTSGPRRGPARLDLTV